MTVSRIAWFFLSLLVAAGFVALWQYVADAGLVSRVFLPGPDRAWAALVQGLTVGELGNRWLGTVERMFYGWLLASFAGILIGAVIGSSERARAYLGPMLELVRPLPASAIVPLAIALLGLSETMVLAVISFGALWPTLLATVHGFSTVEPRLYEVSRALGLPRWKVIMKIALPSSMPDIIAGMRLALTVSLILAVIGEMLASRDGLGSQILFAARSFRSADLFAGVILLGVTGYVSAVALNLVEARVLRWRLSR